MNAGNPIDKETVKAVHAAKSGLSLSDPVYRGLLNRRYGAHTSKDLTDAQGKDLVRYFNEIKSRSSRAGLTCALCMPRARKKSAIPAGTIYPVSPQQLTTIDALKEAIQWNHKDGFSRWLLKYFALAEIEWSPQASVVINALQKLLKSQHKCGSCEVAALSRGKTNE